MQIIYEPVNFLAYTEPFGHLPQFTYHPGAHACFMYAMRATALYEKRGVHENIVIYEHEQWPDETSAPYIKQMKAICEQYNIKPETMHRYWDVVERQFIVLDINLPERIKFSGMKKGIQYASGNRV